MQKFTGDLRGIASVWYWVAAHHGADVRREGQDDASRIAYRDGAQNQRQLST